MDVELDPKDVLAHLNQMGYYVNDIQLEYFMKDLKKLILHEQRKQKERQQRSFSSAASTTSKELEEISSPQSTSESKRHKPTCPKHRHISEPNNSKLCDNSSSSSDSSEGVSAKHAVDGSKTSTKSQRKVLQSRENVVRPKSNFIRPRELSGVRPGSAPQKSDPVALYHHYQQLWKQQKLPGEEPHAELRWSIREKMMGQEQARPVSQASSVDRLSKRPEWI